MASLASTQDSNLSKMEADDPGTFSAACAVVGRASSRVSSLLLQAEIYQLARSDLHILLDAACDLRDAHEVLSAHDIPDDFVLSQTAAYAREVAHVILEQIADWTEFSVNQASSHAVFAAGARSSRARLAALIRRSPSLLPFHIREELSQALQDLENGSGQVPSLFTPTRDAGKGIRPKEARRMRTYLCYWIRWAQGGGKTREAAIGYVASLDGTPKEKAVEKWLESLEKDEAEKPNLERFRQEGRAGMPFFQGRISPEELASMLHEARRQRTPPS